MEAREKPPAARPARLQRPAVREEAAKPQAKQGRRSVRLTLLLMVVIPLAAVAGAYYYARCRPTSL